MFQQNRKNNLLHHLKKKLIPEIKSKTEEDQSIQQRPNSLGFVSLSLARSSFSREETGKNQTPTKILPTTKPVRRNNQRSVLFPRPLLKICYRGTRAQGQSAHRWRKARGDTSARANERDGNRLDRSSYRREPTTPRGEPPVFCFSRWFLRRPRPRLLRPPISFVLHCFLLRFFPSSFYAVWNYIALRCKKAFIFLFFSFFSLPLSLLGVFPFVFKSFLVNSHQIKPSLISSSLIVYLFIFGLCFVFSFHQLKPLSIFFFSCVFFGGGFMVIAC